MPHITVINDDTAFLRLMQDLLAGEGYDVTLHIEGANAHQKVRESIPDLVVLDIRMEQQESGWMVLDLMKLDPKTSHIPVIVTSADHTALHDKEAMLRRQGYEILEKPFDLDTLLEMIETKIGPADGK